MKLLKGHIAAVTFYNSGSFSALDFGAASKMLAWQVYNGGGSDVVLFGNLVVQSRTWSPIFSMQTGYHDTGKYFFTFKPGEPPNITVIATIAGEE